VNQIVVDAAKLVEDFFPARIAECQPIRARAGRL